MKIKKSLKYRIPACLCALLLFSTAFSTTAFAGGPDYEEPVEETTEAEPETGEPLSEETDIVTRDLLYDKATNKQFITIQDREGNVFYLVIDYDAPVNEDEEQYQTYFLNPVDTADLAALAEEGEETVAACTCAERCQSGEVNMNCEVCANDMASCMGTEPVPEPTEEPAETETEEPEETNSGKSNPAILLMLLALFAGGGAFAYLKFFKNRPKTKGSSDLDDYDYGEDEEDADGEDDTPWENEDTEPDTDTDSENAGADDTGEPEETEDDLI